MSLFALGFSDTITASTAKVGAAYSNVTKSPRQRAEALLEQMTWAEKVGQMGGIRRLFSADLAFNKTSYAEIRTLQNGMIGYGSYMNKAQDVLPLVNAIRADRLNIPYITMTDSVNGILLVGGSVFPGSLTMSSSWNPALYGEAIAAIREESLAMGTRWVLSPELDIGKEPRYGRVGEMYGEDAYLNGEFGTQYVKTMQERDANGFVKVAATIKHFVYGLPSGGVNTASMFGGINHIFNDLAPPFIKTIKEAKPLSLMVSYATVDRVPMAANKWMLQSLLRDSMGFEGIIMADAGAIENLYTQAQVASSTTDAALKALRAGIEMELSPAQPAMFPNLVDVVNDTGVAALIDAAVLQFLEIKFASGVFEQPLPTLDLNSTLRAPLHLQANKDISREAIVLLQNDGTLPLVKKSTGKVALLGPFAEVINAGSYAAQNSSQPAFGNTLHASLVNALGASNVQYVLGVDFTDTEEDSGIETALTAAKDAGLAILMLGSLSVNPEDPLFSKRTDGEDFSHADLGLPGLQQELLDAVLDAGVPTVLILSGGQAFVLNNSTLRANTILHSFLGGEFTGDALVEVLFGDVNPSGKLTISLPQANGAFPINYDYLRTDNEAGASFDGYAAWTFPELSRDPPMPFGFGLSYTTFNVSKPTVSFSSGANSSLAVSGSVSNTGNYTGKEVVQLYFSQQYSLIETPVKRLIRFSKLELRPGEVANFTFSVPVGELGYYVHTEWQVDSGNYTFYLGSSSRDADLETANVVLSV
ncbi:hypothetical protein LTR85_009547 [Meristemomyces frigidus]|nr:hypothetical protein LTR85_009547 [Meristemomyces frigidus]